MINYFKGYCLVSVEGASTEKFLNNLIRSGIPVYNVNRISPTKIEFHVNRKDMKKLKELYRNGKYDIKVKKNIGVLFFMRRIYKHKLMWICAIISLMIMIATSMFVTDIHIKSPEGIDKVAIRKELEKAGLKPGVYKKNIDRKNIRDYIMSNFEDVAYVSINVKGTNIFVTITKKAESLNANSQTNYCNIIASKNGIIKKVIPRSGNSLVNPGDIVSTGTVLISGATNNPMPEVWASTFYESKQSETYIKNEKIKTKNEKKVYTVSFYDKAFTLRRNINYKNYIIENKEYKLNVKDYTFPIKIKVSTFNEVNIKKVEQDKEKLKEKLKNKALKDLEYKIPVDARLEKVDHSFNVESDKIVYTVTIRTLENIANKQMLSKSEVEQLLKQNATGEGEVETPQSNPQKMPINDLRNGNGTEKKEEENKKGETKKSE